MTNANFYCHQAVPKMTQPLVGRQPLVIEWFLLSLFAPTKTQPLDP
jgi:hypothetical protein